MKNFFIAAAFVTFFSLSIVGQTSGSNDQARTNYEEAQRRAERERQEKIENERRVREFERLKAVQNPQTPDNNGNRTNSIPTKLTKEQKKQLEVNREDYTKNADFLKQQNTGLVKLFPDLGCFQGMVFVINGSCKDAIGLAMNYSFRRNERAVNTELADLYLKGNSFIAGGLLANGLIISLGDIPLSEIANASEGLDFITNYKAAQNNLEFMEKSAEIQAGFQAGNYFYSDTAEATSNTTYLMRVIAYRDGSNIPGLSSTLNTDKRADILVGFRVIRKDSDGGITLLWRVLRKSESPKIAFAKAGKIQTN